MGVGQLWKGVEPINKNLYNDKPTIEIIKNPVRDKPTKVNKKSTKAKNKLATKIVKNLVNHVRRVIIHGHHNEELKNWDEE